jgi:hypothetical protein
MGCFSDFDPPPPANYKKGAGNLVFKLDIIFIFSSDLKNKLKLQ